MMSSPGNPDEIKRCLNALGDEYLKLMDQVDGAKESLLNTKEDFYKSDIYASDISGNAAAAACAMGNAETSLQEAASLLLAFQDGIQQLCDAIGNA